MTKACSEVVGMDLLLNHRTSVLILDILERRVLSTFI